MITVARLTPPADPSPWTNLAHQGPTAFITACLFAALILALGPGLAALLRLAARMTTQVRRGGLIDQWADEEAPRKGSA